jgi:hypothetical protein
VKLEKFEEIEFDKLVTDETLRQFLGYKIPSNKKTMTKRGMARRKDDAPRSPRPAVKRTSEAAASSFEGIPSKKKKSIPLAASGARRTPPERHVPESNTEEGSMSFRGFVPKAPQHHGEGSSSPFGLRDESSSEASHHGLEIPLDEPEGVAFGAKSLAPPRTEEGAESTPEPSPQQTPRRVKHTAQRKKFGPRDRLASIILEAEEMLGRPRYSPSEVEGFQPELCSSAETEEGCEGEETPEVSLMVEEVSSSPVTVPRNSTPYPEGHNEGT